MIVIFKLAVVLSNRRVYLREEEGKKSTYVGRFSFLALFRKFRSRMYSTNANPGTGIPISS